MAVKIRLQRRGRKKYAFYNVVVADSRSPRDGKYIERLGVYNPNTNPATIDIDDQKAFDWVMKGAQPTDTVKAMLSYRGIMLKKHLQIGVNKGAITQEEADKRFDEWMKEKESKITGKVESLAQAKEAEAKKRQEAEAKVRAAKEEAIRKRKEEEEAAAKAAEAETQEGEAPAEGGEEASNENE
jgi:small subunit ribosomal protein S16